MRNLAKPKIEDHPEIAAFKIEGVMYSYEFLNSMAHETKRFLVAVEPQKDGFPLLYRYEERDIAKIVEFLNAGFEEGPSPQAN